MFYQPHFETCKGDTRILRQLLKQGKTKFLDVKREVAIMHPKIKRIQSFSLVFCILDRVSKIRKHKNTAISF